MVKFFVLHQIFQFFCKGKVLSKCYLLLFLFNDIGVLRIDMPQYSIFISRLLIMYEEGGYS